MSGRRDGWHARRYFSASLRDLLRPMHDWTEKAATQAEVRVFILDNLYRALPRPPFTIPEIVVANSVAENPATMTSYTCDVSQSVGGMTLVRVHGHRSVS